MATFLEAVPFLLLPAVIATLIYLGLGGWLADVVMRLQKALFALVNVPAGIWVLAHGYVVPGTAMLGVGLTSGITVIEYFVDPLPRWLHTARVRSLAAGVVALVMLFVKLALGYYRLRGRTVAAVLFVVMIAVPLVLALARTRPIEAKVPALRRPRMSPEAIRQFRPWKYI